MIKIPDYEIKEPLGEGGMATVYLAIHKRLQREVALKIMKPETSSTKAFHKSFIAEGRTVAKLEHPNIIKIYDIDTQNGHLYMSMELLRKGNLKQRLDNGKLPVSNALRVTTQIADALNYAHKQGYIHRDIKPANIMFREDNSAVLTDFGIAKMQGTTGEMTQMGYIAGTPYYMAPEQATGNYQIDQRVDIYSLGIVFYEMLTGTKPYTGSNTIAISYEHVHAPIPTLEGKLNIFQAVVDKALAKKPQDRFYSVADFSQALRTAAAQSSDTVLVASDLPTPVQVKKTAIWLWLIAGALVSLGGITGTYYYSKSTAEKRIIAQQQELERQATQQKQVAEKNEAAQAAERKRIKQEKIANYLNFAKMRNEERKVFDHSNWSEGCKNYLINIDGPYDPKDTSEWYHRTVLTLDKDNPQAKTALQKIATRKQLDFSNCDDFRFAEENNAEIDSLFAD